MLLLWRRTHEVINSRARRDAAEEPALLFHLLVVNAIRRLNLVHAAFEMSFVVVTDDAAFVVDSGSGGCLRLALVEVAQVAAAVTATAKTANVAQLTHLPAALNGIAVVNIDWVC